MFDLIGYAHRVAGLDHVATVFCELADDISPELLVVAARTAPVTRVRQTRHCPLWDYVRQHAHGAVLLVPGLPKGRARRAKDWQPYINAEIEVDL